MPYIGYYKTKTKYYYSDEIDEAIQSYKTLDSCFWYKYTYLTLMLTAETLLFFSSRSKITSCPS